MIDTTDRGRRDLITKQRAEIARLEAALAEANRRKKIAEDLASGDVAALRAAEAANKALVEALEIAAENLEVAWKHGIGCLPALSECRRALAAAQGGRDDE